MTPLQNASIGKWKNYSFKILDENWWNAIKNQLILVKIVQIWSKINLIVYEWSIFFLGKFVYVHGSSLKFSTASLFQIQTLGVFDIYTYCSVIIEVQVT